jgi:hypothetical protein
MNRKKIYFTTLIFPLMVLVTILTVGFILDWSYFGNSLIRTSTEEWYHIIGGIIAIILGIEYFGRNLENQLKSEKRFWVGFKYVLKVFGFFIISNIITNTIDGAKYLDGIGDVLDKIMYLIIISLPVYLIMTCLVSLIIGLIISKSELGKTNANNV